MVVKVDKSKEFVKSGKVLVSEYPAIHPKPTKTTKSEWKHKNYTKFIRL